MSFLQPAQAYKVVVYSVGAVVTVTLSGNTTHTVARPHSFTAGDKVLRNPMTDKELIVISSVGATTLTFTTSVSLNAGDVLVNLGATETGTTPSNLQYNGSNAVIYTNPNYATVIANSTIQTSSQGEYEYYYKGDGLVWELVLSPNDEPADLVKGFGQVQGRYNIADFGVEGAAITAAGATGAVFDPDDDTTVQSTLLDDVTLTGDLSVAGSATVTGAVEIDGALNHDGSTVGFYGIAPVTRAAAYTQTYSTADRTHATQNSAALTDSTTETADQTIASAKLTDSSGGTPDGTVAAVSGSGADATINNNFAECAASANTLNKNCADMTDEINKLVTEMTDLKQLVNSVIDDLQALGLVQ